MNKNESVVFIFILWNKKRNERKTRYNFRCRTLKIVFNFWLYATQAHLIIQFSVLKFLLTTQFRMWQAKGNNQNNNIIAIIIMKKEKESELPIGKMSSDEFFLSLSLFLSNKIRYVPRINFDRIDFLYGWWIYRKRAKRN